MLNTGGVTFDHLIYRSSLSEVCRSEHLPVIPLSAPFGFYSKNLFQGTGLISKL